MFVAGGVGLWRGAGLRFIDIPSVVDGPLGVLTMPAGVAAVGGGVSLLGLLMWTRSRSGFKVELLAQNEEFALELGIERRDLAAMAGAVSGAALGWVALYVTMTGGNSPEGGLPLTLIGIAGAFILPGRRLVNAVVGGALLGGTQVVLELLVSPVLASALLFVGVATLLAWRGTNRTALEVR
jgi:branched-subunit amino acid ABC-type transport system permease component